MLNGFFYAVSGLVSQHFRKNLLPARAALSWSSISRTVSEHLHLKRPTEKHYPSWVRSRQEQLAADLYECLEERPDDVNC